MTEFLNELSHQVGAWDNQKIFSCPEEAQSLEGLFPYLRDGQGDSSGESIVQVEPRFFCTW